MEIGRIDPNGDSRADVDGDGVPELLPVEFWDEDPIWKSSIDALDGAPFLQARITSVNHVESAAERDLSSLGIAFSVR